MAAVRRRAELRPADVEYLETHGTGTQVGDPIEARAAVTACGCGRDQARPLLIGSIETNVGHLEAAAGAAEVIRAELASTRTVVPECLYFREPSQDIDWSGLPRQLTAHRRPRTGRAFPMYRHEQRQRLRLVRNQRPRAGGLPWPAGNRRRRSGAVGRERGPTSTPSQTVLRGWRGSGQMQITVNCSASRVGLSCMP